jgi:hypothetical protein
MLPSRTREKSVGMKAAVSVCLILWKRTWAGKGILQGTKMRFFQWILWWLWSLWPRKLSEKEKKELDDYIDDQRQW